MGSQSSRQHVASGLDSIESRFSKRPITHTSKTR